MKKAVIGIPDHLVGGEIVLPGGPHVCVMDHVDTSHFEVKGTLDVYFQYAELVKVVLDDPRSRKAQYRMTTADVNDLAAFMRFVDEPSKE